jgi:hypothetical protein
MRKSPSRINCSYSNVGFHLQSRVQSQESEFKINTGDVAQKLVIIVLS